jgi:hypothetical protein
VVDCCPNESFDSTEDLSAGEGGMIKYASEVTIGRPPDAVFPYLIEREKQAL